MELYRLTIHEAGARLAAGEFTALELTEAVLDRILAVYEKQLAEMTERILERLEVALRAQMDSNK